MPITRFEDIEAWQLARELTLKVYQATQKDKFSRDYGLKDQIQRADGSSMHNIAEGFDSGTNPEFTRFLSYAQRSCTEVQSQLYIALDQKYMTEKLFQELYDLSEKTKSKIGGFIKYLKNSNRS